jgi:hypothetical protein
MEIRFFELCWGRSIGAAISCEEGCCLTLFKCKSQDRAAGRATHLLHSRCPYLAAKKMDWQQSAIRFPMLHNGVCIESACACCATGARKHRAMARLTVPSE